MHEIIDASVGQYAFQTASGSMFHLDLDGASRYVTRLPREFDPDSYEGVPFETSELRRDRDPLRLVKVLHLVLGERAVLAIDLREDGIPTLRETTPVLRITILGGRNIDTVE